MDHLFSKYNRGWHHFSLLVTFSRALVNLPLLPPLPCKVACHFAVGRGTKETWTVRKTASLHLNISPRIPSHQKEGSLVNSHHHPASSTSSTGISHSLIFPSQPTTTKIFLFFCLGSKAANHCSLIGLCHQLTGTGTRGR